MKKECSNSIVATSVFRLLFEKKGESSGHLREFTSLYPKKSNLNSERMDNFCSNLTWNRIRKDLEYRKRECIICLVFFEVCSNYELWRKRHTFRLKTHVILGQKSENAQSSLNFREKINKDCRFIILLETLKLQNPGFWHHYVTNFRPPAYLECILKSSHFLWKNATIRSLQGNFQCATKAKQNHATFTDFFLL